MTDLDTILMRLATAPLPTALDSIDERVFSGVVAVRSRRLARGIGLVTIGAALAMGVASSAMPAREVGAQSLAPLSSVPPLSPAALLGVTR